MHTREISENMSIYIGSIEICAVCLTKEKLNETQGNCKEDYSNNCSYPSS